MNAELLVIANATHARFFSRQSDHDPLVPLDTVEAADARLKSSELADDRLGHGRQDSRPGGVSFTPRIDPRRKKQLAFAHELAHRIDDSLAQPGVTRVSIFSSCPFLGALKSQLSPKAKKALRSCVDSDLTHLDVTEIERRVDQLAHKKESLQP